MRHGGRPGCGGDDGGKDDGDDGGIQAAIHAVGGCESPATASFPRDVRRVDGICFFLLRLFIVVGVLELLVLL